MGGNFHPDPCPLAPAVLHATLENGLIMFYLAIGLVIRKLRDDKGMTARELGEVADYRDYEISRIERGLQKLDLEGSLRIAKAFGMSLNELVDLALKVKPQVANHKEALEHASNARQRLRELVKAIET